MLELLATGAAKDRKRAYRFAKVRLGSHKRATIKRAELEKVILDEKMAEME